MSIGAGAGRVAAANNGRLVSWPDFVGDVLDGREADSLESVGAVCAAVFVSGGAKDELSGVAVATAVAGGAN